MDYNLLKEIRQDFGLEKKAYVPPPFDQSLESTMPPGGPQYAEGTGVADPMIDPEQIKQEIQQAMQNGTPPDQLFQSLTARGVPKETLQQIMQELEQGQQGGEQPQPQQGQQPPQVSNEELIQMAEQAEKNGKSPEEFVKELMSSGISKEQIQAVVEEMAKKEEMGEEPPPSASPPPPKVPIKDRIDQYVTTKIKELKSQKMNPEERLFAIEKKVEAMADLLEEFMTKKSFDAAYYDAIFTKENNND